MPKLRVLIVSVAAWAIMAGAVLPSEAGARPTTLVIHKKDRRFDVRGNIGTSNDAALVPVPRSVPWYKSLDITGVTVRRRGEKVDFTVSVAGSIRWVTTHPPSHIDVEDLHGLGVGFPMPGHTHGHHLCERYCLSLPLSGRHTWLTATYGYGGPGGAPHGGADRIRIHLTYTRHSVTAHLTMRDLRHPTTLLAAVSTDYQHDNPACRPGYDDHCVETLWANDAFPGPASVFGGVEVRANWASYKLGR